MLVGPSGCGKSSIEAGLTRKGIERLRSHTTRPKRVNEADDAYYFVSLEEFQATPMIESVEYDGNRYGLSEAEVRKTDDVDKDFVAVVEMHGVIQLLKEANCETQIIFIDATDSDLIGRLSARGPGGTDRLRLVEKERKLKRLCDFTLTNSNGQLDRLTNIIANFIQCNSVLETYQECPFKVH